MSQYGGKSQIIPHTHGEPTRGFREALVQEGEKITNHWYKRLFYIYEHQSFLLSAAKHSCTKKEKKKKRQALKHTTQ